MQNSNDFNTNNQLNSDDKISLSSEYSDFINKMMHNKKTYDIDNSDSMEVGGVVKTAHGITNDGKKGGYFDGRPHSEGGIKAVNVDTNTPIEVEGGEVVITKKAVSDKTKRNFMGKKMTNKEILSFINQSGGGVPLMQRGGQVFDEGGEIKSFSVSDEGLTGAYDSIKSHYDFYVEENQLTKEGRSNISMVIELLKTKATRLKLELSILSKSIDTERYGQVINEFNEISNLIAKYEIAKSISYPSILKHFIDSLNERGNALNLISPNTQNGFDIQDPKRIPQPYDKIVYTSNFKEWFGDWELAKLSNNYYGVSKCLDENGFPEIYFHGGRQYQTTYRPFPNISVFYWAQDFRYAEWFAQNAFASGDEDSVVLRAYVSCKNPIDLMPFGHRPVDLGDLVRYVIAFYPQTNLKKFLPQQYKDLLKNEQQFGITVRAWQLIRQFNSWVTYVRDQKIFDGFMYAENNPSQIINGQEHTTRAFAIFHSNQIKFPNQMTFNTFLDDFRFDEGGIVI